MNAKSRTTSTIIGTPPISTFPIGISVAPKNSIYRAGDEIQIIATSEEPITDRAAEIPFTIIERVGSRSKIIGRIAASAGNNASITYTIPWNIESASITIEAISTAPGGQIATIDIPIAG